MKMNVKRLLALAIMIAGLMAEAPIDARRGGGGGRGGRGGGGMRGGRGGGMRGGRGGGMRHGGGRGMRGGRGGRHHHHGGRRGHYRHGYGRHHRHGGRGYYGGYYGGYGYYPWWGWGYGYPYYGGVTYVNGGSDYLTDDAGYAYWDVRNSTNRPIYVSTSGSDRIYIRPGGRARLYHPNSFYFNVESNGQVNSLYSQTHNVNIIQDGAGNFVIGYY